MFYKMLKVVVAGKFDPLHNGHIDSIIKASRLGDYLYVIVNPDDIVAKCSKKGFCAIPLATRILIIEGVLMRLKIRGEVLVSHDSDGTVASTLEELRPDIFAKGGDRIPTNMPNREVAVCSKIGCRIVYNIGDLLNSSSSICPVPF